jgi:hypothetical protein
MYKAILFALDGDYVTDFERKTKQEVINELAEMGSRWFFYPITGIITADGRLINRKRVDFDYPEMKPLSGLTVRTVQKYIAKNDMTWMLQ